MQHPEVTKLAKLLRNDGDKILDASSKLSLSSTLLLKLNESISSIFPNNITCQYDNFFDLQLLYDFITKTLGLKIFSDYNKTNQDEIDLKLFQNLRLLEVQRLSMNLIRGLKHLRSQLEYVTCMRSITALKDVFETCGGDQTQGYVWCELKEAVFSHNNLNVVDASLEFVPWLQYLDLSFNFIENIEPLNCLSNLKYLNLANNKIVSIPIFSGPLCSNLKVLILRNNYLEDIKEIEALINLNELDLSNNFICEFKYLEPLANLRLLIRLSLEDNPIYYDFNYRAKTSSYLNINISSLDFRFDKKPLTKRELRMVGSIRPSASYMERCESFNSNTTACTVVQKKDANHTSDFEVSCGSIEQLNESKHEEEVKTTNFQEQGMHDSGFVAGPRPASPSDSIGSANSLQSDLHRVIGCSESDIEILSNPSQSSIEVLSSQTPRCVQSCIVIPQTIKEICIDSDLNNVGDELHRSL